MTKDQINQWFNDAAADGWEVTPFMQGEPIEYSAILKKPPFKAFVFRRPDGFLPGFKEQYGIHVWGTDGLAVRMDVRYNYDRLLQIDATCAVCDKPRTKRLGFAAGVCDDHYEAYKHEYEPKGWER